MRPALYRARRRGSRPWATPASGIRRVSGRQYKVYTSYSEGPHGVSSFTATIPKRGETHRLRPSDGHDTYVALKNGTIGICNEFGEGTELLAPTEASP